MLSDLYIRLRSLFHRGLVNQELDEENEDGYTDRST